MAKLTIEELYRGDKYEIMSAVGAQAMKLDIDPQTDEGQTWIEMEYIRQTLIAAEKMKENGDCIYENEDLLTWLGKLIVAEIINDTVKSYAP